MCYHRRGSWWIFLFRRQCLEREASDSDDEADDGYYNKNSNTSEWLDRMSWLSQAIAILGLLLVAGMVSGFIPIFFVMMVVMVYMMMMTVLVKMFEQILQPLLLLKQREESSQKLLRKIKIKIKIKKKIKLKKCIMLTSWDECIQKEMALQGIFCLPLSWRKSACVKTKIKLLPFRLLFSPWELCQKFTKHLIRLLPQMIG